MQNVLGEHSAIPSTFIKLPFFINILILSIFFWGGGFFEVYVSGRKEGAVGTKMHDVVALTVNSRQQFQFSGVGCFQIVYVHFIFRSAFLITLRYQQLLYLHV